MKVIGRCVKVIGWCEVDGIVFEVKEWGVKLIKSCVQVSEDVCW